MKNSKDYTVFPRIDDQIIQNLQELNEPDEELPFFEGLIHLYFKEAPIAFHKLEQALEKSDVPAVVHFSHKLKGLSRNLGLRRMAEICATIEHGGASLVSEDLRDLLEQSRAELDQVIVALSRYLQAPAAKVS